MGLYDSYREVSGMRKTETRRRMEENREKSKIRLEKSIKKKFETSFIGAINSVEERFGDRWGRDLDRNERTKEQVIMLRIWLALRSEILDKGNAQLRGMLRELEDYDVDYKGKSVVFEIGENE